jgi:hypothetical protein
MHRHLTVVRGKQWLDAQVQCQCQVIVRIEVAEAQQL